MFTLESRRNLNRGQQAMLIALGLLKISMSQNEAAKQSGINRGRIWTARFVIEHAPDKVELVLNNGMSLEEAAIES